MTDTEFEGIPEFTGEIIITAESYRRSAQIGTLFGALAKAQASYGTLERTKTARVKGRSPRGNEYEYSYTYATLSDTIEATQALHENGFSVMQFPTVSGEKIAVTTLLGHELGQWIESTLEAAPVEWSVQSMGSAITFLRRYTRQAISGIAPADDDGAAAIRAPEPTVLYERSHSKAPRAGEPQAQQKVAPVEFRPPAPAVAPYNPETGEALPPHDIDVTGDWVQWGGIFVAALKTSKTGDELAEWSRLNADHLQKMAEEQTKAFDRVQANIKEQRLRLQQQLANSLDNLVTPDEASSVLQ